MLCNNCKAEMPADSKFCPMCGAKNEPAPQPTAEKFCTGCGVQLEAGAKFCTLCGTPVDGTAKTAAPSEPVSMGYAGNVDAAPATPSAIPTPVNDTAAKPVSAIPTPVNDTATKPTSAIPTPVNDTAAKPVSAIPTPVNSNTAQPVFGSVPTPAADSTVNLNKTTDTTSSENSSSFSVPSYDYSMGADAAAVSATPIKKKNFVLPIVLGVIAALLIAGGIFFLVNKSAVMQLFMGNSGYARMIEGSGIKSVSELAAQPSVAAGVESALTAAASAAAAENMDTDDLSSYSEAININQYINTVSASMMDAYGKNGATVDIDFDLNLTDNAKSTLAGEGAETAELDEMLDFINSTEITYKAAVTEDAISAYAAVYDSEGLAIDAQGIIYSDGNVVIKFPFGSDKCIVGTIDDEYISTEEAPTIDLSEEEFERLATEIIDLYLTTYEQGEVTIETGDFTIGGVTATGKKITTKLSAEQLNKLFIDATTLIAEDEYFCNTIVDYINDCGGLMTYDEFKTEILDMGKEMATLEEGTDFLEVMTIVNNSNTVLAKSYTAYDDYSAEETEDDKKGDTAMIGYINGESAFAFEMDENGAPLIIAVVEKTGETDGKAAVKIYEDGKFVMTVKVDYTGVKTEQYNGNDMTVGKFDISFEMPQDFTADTDEMMTMLSTASISYSLNLSEVEGEKVISCNMSINVPQYFTFALDALTTPSEEEIPTVPSDAIDITNLLMNEGEELTEADLATIDQLSAMVDDIAAAADKMSDDSLYKELLVMLTDELKLGIDELKNPTADFDAIYEVITELYELEEALYNIDDMYPDGADAVSADIEAIEAKTEALDEELYTFEVSAARLTEIKNEIASLDTEVEGLTAKAKDAQEKYDAEQEAASAVDYDELNYDEIIDQAIVVENRFFEAVLNNSGQLYTDDALFELYEIALESYDEMYTALDTMVTKVESGDMKVQYVRDARKALAAFDEDVTAFENAIIKTDNTAA